jgi:diguanylate cyclase (GGDEF)-like protein
LSRLADLALSTDPVRRRPLGLILLGLVNYLINAGLSWWAIGAGYTEPMMGEILIAYIVIGPTVFYALARSGYSLRFKDPSMVMVQSLFCVLSIVLAFMAVITQVRGVVLMVLPVVVMFGQFTLHPRQISRICQVAIGALALVTLGWWAFKTPGHQFTADFFQWVFICAILLTTSRVAQTVSRMRFNLERSRTELAAALTKVNEMATRDELTGLINRRRMLELLAEELKRERRLELPLCVALLDIDHFKRVNDTHGHQTGDEVLRHFAQVARASLRETDTLARWGGEEFLLLCPASTSAQAVIGLTRLRRQLADQPFTDTTNGAQIAPPITFSAGIALHRPGESIEDTIARADQSLYQAKAEGRDRTVQNP